MRSLCDAQSPCVGPERHCIQREREREREYHVPASRLIVVQAHTSIQIPRKPRKDGSVLCLLAELLLLACRLALSGGQRDSLRPSTRSAGSTGYAVKVCDWQRTRLWPVHSRRCTAVVKQAQVRCSTIVCTVPVCSTGKMTACHLRLHRCSQGKLAPSSSKVHLSTLAAQVHQEAEGISSTLTLRCLQVTLQ